jgi:hypothetical protein
MFTFKFGAVLHRMRSACCAERRKCIGELYRAILRWPFIMHCHACIAANICDFAGDDIGYDDPEQETRLADLYVHASLNCASPIELAYYSAGHEILCIHCGTEENLVEKARQYPQCNISTAKPVPKRGRNRVQ